MKKTVLLWSFFGFAATVLAGTILHFLYTWLGEPLWIAPFSAINESTWEHMKLLFWPMLIFAAPEGIAFRSHESLWRAFWCIKLGSITLGIALIPILFYTYNGVIGKSPDWINIAIFFVAAAAAYAYEARLFNSTASRCKSQRIAIAALLAIALLFVIFTFAPPPLAIFQDPRG